MHFAESFSSSILFYFSLTKSLTLINSQIKITTQLVQEAIQTLALSQTLYIVVNFYTDRMTILKQWSFTGVLHTHNQLFLFIYPT